jgi:hypothetical protein
MDQTKTQDKLRSGKVVRVLVYEGDLEWIKRTLSHGIKKKLDCGRGWITETFCGSDKEFVQKFTRVK